MDCQPEDRLIGGWEMSVAQACIRTIVKVLLHKLHHHHIMESWIFLSGLYLFFKVRKNEDVKSTVLSP